MNTQLAADSHLLFGLLALQNGLVSRAQLVAMAAKLVPSAASPKTTGGMMSARLRRSDLIFMAMPY